MTRSCLPALALFLSPFCAAETPEIQTRKLADGGYELTVTTSRTTNPDDAQRLLFPAAQALCGTLSPRFGRFEFTGSERLSGTPNPADTTLTLKQEMHCDTSARTPSGVVTQPNSAWQPGDRDKASVENLSYRYLEMKDRGSLSEAWALLSHSMQQTTTFALWSDAAQQFRDKAGRVEHRSIHKFTWYKDPPSAPEPGVYVAADFMGAYENIAIQCGYIAWHQQRDGTFRIVREEIGLVDRPTYAKLKDDDIKIVRQRLGCPDH